MTNKKLKVGNVPNLRFPSFEGEWEVKKLGDVAEKIGDGLHGTPSYTDESNYYFINGNNLVNGKIEITENTKKIDAETFLKNDKNLRKNTILISINGTIGTIAKYNNENVMLGKSVGYFNFEENSDFLYFVLQTSTVQEYFKSELTGSTIKNLSLKTLRETNLRLPSQDEQQKIASFLSLIDERITTQNKIIEQLETLIKGLSEKLFYQKIRFKDFTDEWELKSLGDIFYSEKGKGISKDKLTVNGKYECVLYGELYTKYKEVIFDVVSKTNEDDGLKSQIGDLLIPSSTTTTGIDLANVTAINKENVLLGGDITVLRSKDKINNVFYAYYLSNYKKTEIASYAQGSTIVHLYYSHIKNMSIDFPSFEEQAVIAQFLSFIDMKIQTEKNILDTYHSQKKHLLQNLFI